MKIETEHGIFTDRIDLDNNIIKTAEEVYQEWLIKKDKPAEEPNKIDNLKSQLYDANNMIIDLQFQILTLGI